MEHTAQDMLHSTSSPVLTSLKQVLDTPSICLGITLLSLSLFSLILTCSSQGGMELSGPCDDSPRAGTGHLSTCLVMAWSSGWWSMLTLLSLPHSDTSLMAALALLGVEGLNTDPEATATQQHIITTMAKQLRHLPSVWEDPSPHPSQVVPVIS